MDDKDEEVVNEFAKQFNDLDVFKSYEGKTTKIDEPFNENNISSHLAENYKYSIQIKDIDEEDQKDIKDIRRQVERLRYSVLQTKYSVCLTYKHYFAILKDDKVNVFQIMNHMEGFFSVSTTQRVGRFSIILQ